VCEHNNDSSVEDSTMADRRKTQKESLKGNTTVYGTSVELNKEFAEMNFVSVVIFRSGGWGILFYRDGRNVGKEIMVQKLERTNWGYHHMMHYWQWTLTGVPEPLLETNPICDFAVLLPIMGKEDAPGVFSIVTREWSTEMLGQYNMSKEGQGIKNDDAQDETTTSNENNGTNPDEQDGIYDGMVLDAEWT
jgi:hypothetical protein